MEINNILSALEAVLFLHGEPLEIKKLAKILNIEEEKITQSLGDLSESLKSENRGLTLVIHNNQVQLATKPEFASFVEGFVKEEFDENLTPAALETLSLISYLGPVSRSKIDYLRGVNSSYTIRNLMMRGLVEKSLDPKNGHIYLYQASVDLLKYLGVSKIEDLPEYEKYKGICLNSESEGEQNLSANSPSVPTLGMMENKLN